MAEAQKQEELPLEVDNEEVEVDLQETKEEVKVEQVEDAKETEAEDKGEEGLDGYSKKVRKRIEEMTYKIREAERREKAAIEYAQGLQKEKTSLNKKSSAIIPKRITTPILKCAKLKYLPNTKASKMPLKVSQ